MSEIPPYCRKPVGKRHHCHPIIATRNGFDIKYYATVLATSLVHLALQGCEGFTLGHLNARVQAISTNAWRTRFRTVLHIKSIKAAILEGLSLKLEDSRSNT